MIEQLLSEEDLLRAIKNGTLRENRFIEVKSRPAAASERREAARDLASMALDGGVIVFGVRESTDERLEPDPFPLARESERIENIAANAVEPPVPIRVHAVQSTADSSMGYLVVEVPPSPLAPHMVDHQYWARAERTKRRLGDAEVVRLHSQRRQLESNVELALDQELDRDPDPRPRARMHLVAVPLLGPPRMAAAFTTGAARSMLDLTARAEAGVPERMWGWSPETHDLSSTVRRAQGLARTNLADGRRVLDASQAEYATDIEIQTSGSVRAMVTGFHYLTKIRRVEGDVPVVTEGIFVAWCFRLISLAAEVGRIAEYRGPWGFGIVIDGLQGTRAHEENHLVYQRPVFEMRMYRKVSTATSSEVGERPGAIVERIIGDLLLALEKLGDYRQDLDSRRS